MEDTSGFFSGLERIATKVLDYRLSKGIDAERNVPYTFNDAAGGQWTVVDGQIYQRGVPAVNGVAATGSVLSSPIVMLSLLAVGGIALFVLLKD